MIMKVLLLSTILLTGSPILAAGPSAAKQSTAVAPTLQLGADVVRQVRADYAAGKYNEFLKEMDKAYAEAKTNGDLTGLIELRAAETPKPSDAFLKGYDTIQKEKSKELLKAIAGQDNTLFIQKVRSAASNPTSAAEESALTSLAVLATRAPGSGNNADENKLIDIDLEYAYKSIHLDSLAANGKSISDRKEKQLALKMARMDQMVKTANTFEDKALKAQVGTIAAHFDERLAKMFDIADLSALARGKVKPSSALEEKIVAIYTNANEELAQLHLDEMMK